MDDRRVVPDNEKVEKRRPCGLSISVGLQGHIEDIRADGDSYKFTVYLYDDFEGYMAYIMAYGIYGFTNPIPKEWKDCPLYSLLGEASIRRIVSAIECRKAYA